MHSCRTANWTTRSQLNYLLIQVSFVLLTAAGKTALTQNACLLTLPLEACVAFRF